MTRIERPISYPELNSIEAVPIRKLNKLPTKSKDRYLGEFYLSGVRAFVSVNNDHGEVEIITKDKIPGQNQIDVSKKLPEIRSGFREVARYKSAIFDGVIVYGRSTEQTTGDSRKFVLIRLNMEENYTEEQVPGNYRCEYLCTDLIFDGKDDLRRTPTKERRQKLDYLGNDLSMLGAKIKISPFFEDIKTASDQVQRNKLRGLVIKPAAGQYIVNTSEAWFRIDAAKLPPPRPLSRTS